MTTISNTEGNSESPFTSELRYTNLRAYIRFRLLIAVALLFIFPAFVIFISTLVVNPPDLIPLGITEEEYERLRREMQFDKPAIVRTLSYLGNAIIGDFGTSYFEDKPVSALIFDRLPATMLLLLLSLLVGLVVSIPIGAMAASRRHAGAGIVAKGVVALCAGMPGFWLALLLIMIVVFLGSPLPPGSITISLPHLILPCLALGLLSVGYMTPVIRSAFVEAREGGATPSTWRGVRVVLISAPALLGGFLAAAVVIETVFAFPGIGRLLVYAIIQRDFPLLQAIVLVMGMMVLLATVVTLGFTLLQDTSTVSPESGLQAQPERGRPPAASTNVPRAPLGARGLGILALIALAILIFVALFAPIFAPHDPTRIDPQARLMSPSSQHLMGTDSVGRDVLSRVIYGARPVLFIAIISLILVGVVGGALGISASSTGRREATIFLAAMDTLSAFPALVFAMFWVGLLGPSYPVVVAAVALVLLPRSARVVRDEMTALNHGEGYRDGYKDSAGAVDAVLSPVTLHIGLAILLGATLSFLGAGVPPPAATWGNMIAEGRNYILYAWWLSFFPGLPLVLITVVMMAFPFRWSKLHWL